MFKGRIVSDYAVLDVKGKGRHKLTEHFSSRPCLGECPEELRIPVVITGYIDDAVSCDDGVSIEFGVIVQSVHMPK